MPEVLHSDPAETAAFADIGGVHYSEGIDAAWRQAVLSRGKLLLLTGRSLPGQPGPDPRRSLEALGELWAAVVPVRAV